MTTTVEGSKERFEFGKHATFHLREGWLSKGMRDADKTAGFVADLDTADRLGLGSRMVKSLAFWLEATGVTRAVEVGKSKKKVMLPSAFGRALIELDPYLEFSASLWMAHVNLANRTGTVWNWFFNDFSMRSFDREACSGAFVRHIRERAKNPATLNTTQREINCLLALYARPAAAEAADPEDATVSPFRSLGVLMRNFETGTYERTRPLDKIPVEAFLAAVSAMCGEGGVGTIRLSELVGGRNAPGRLMNLDGDAVNELVERAVSDYAEDGVEIALLGSDRVITTPVLPPERWLKKYFQKAASSA
ncbi:DUF4007 family protein [Roseibium suaedae]|uniref:DUF4007 domain-containing protein n=1 Tax=Roseibium suaedae TaxID=735517 RepID=A0A1M7L6Q5_9HYPH|nr:DUF4007 family protein [Roseibium suaedae]SHM73194.1 Protein of unknown function [Roseibium suaedae]